MIARELEHDSRQTALRHLRSPTTARHAATRPGRSSGFAWARIDPRPLFDEGDCGQREKAAGAARRPPLRLCAIPDPKALPKRPGDREPRSRPLRKRSGSNSCLLPPSARTLTPTPARADATPRSRRRLVAVSGMAISGLPSPVWVNADRPSTSGRNEMDYGRRNRLSAPPKYLLQKLALFPTICSPIPQTSDHRLVRRS
jgi:hypothetical protein